MLQVKPKRYNYSLGGEFNKNNDLAVSLYHPETGFSPVSMEEVDVKVGGDTADPSVFFEDLTNDEKYWPVTVRYADMDPVQYTITVGTPKGPNSGDPSGPTIVITGGIEIKIGWE
ncbi:hypothetical protein AGMMS49940_04250 [Spirochaetia bacterium]|nr:hypothetical protein AGMMS49940_04250 [Spirochaetia bacterium]